MSYTVVLSGWEILFECLLWQLCSLRLFHHLAGNIVFLFLLENEINTENV